MDLQKKTLAATERDEEARGAFKERLRGGDAKRLVFVDESSTNIALAPRYARAPKGERAHGKAPRNWGKNVTLISSITLSGMGSSMSIEGSSDTESFGLYMRTVLAPRLKAGQIVLMDNLSVHRSGWVRELIEERGCELWLLPSYSPDFNPIRRSLLHSEEPAEKGEGKDAGGTLRGHRPDTPSGQRGGRPRLLRGLRLQDVPGPLITKTAVSFHTRDTETWRGIPAYASGNTSTDGVADYNDGTYVFLASDPYP